MYDLMRQADAGAMLMLPFFNYADGNHDAIYEMMSHPAAVSGLSDGGAHCGWSTWCASRHWTPQHFSASATAA
jgi:N-acyl-D-aspartate/D-glutamate deacylase